MLLFLWLTGSSSTHVLVNYPSSCSFLCYFAAALNSDPTVCALPL